MENKYSSGEYQENVRQLVGREVYYCASHFFSEIAKKSEHFPEYEDDIFKLSGEYDPETEEYNEIYEHWIISDWLAKKLMAKGEAVAFDFFGFTIWGRSTTGQAIYIDRVICDIYDDLQKEIESYRI